MATPSSVQQSGTGHAARLSGGSDACFPAKRISASDGTEPGARVTRRCARQGDRRPSERVACPRFDSDGIRVDWPAAWTDLGTVVKARVEAASHSLISEGTARSGLPLDAAGSPTMPRAPKREGVAPQGLGKP